MSNRVWRRWGRSVGLVALAVGLGASSAQALTAKDIMARTETWNKPQDETGAITILLIDKSGKERRRDMVRSVQTDANKKDQSFLEFTAPADVRGTRFLTHEHIDRDDDRWMYLPALRKVRRISASDNTDNFMGTDLTLEDIRSEHLETHTYTILREDTIEGRAAYVIEAVPATPQEQEESGYSKRLVWVDTATFLIRQEQFWNKKKEHIKTSRYFELKQLAPDLWGHHRIEVENHKTGHRSVFLFGERTLNTGLSDEIFSQSSLTRGK